MTVAIQINANATVSRLTVRGVRASMALLNTAGSAATLTDVLVDGCHVDGGNIEELVAFADVNAARVTVVNCHLAHGARAVNIAPPLTVDSRVDVVVAGNTVRPGPSGGIRVAGGGGKARGVRIVDNVVVKGSLTVGGPGIDVSAVDGAVVAGNTVEDLDQDGIVAVDVTGSRIVGNRVGRCGQAADATYDAIRLDGDSDGNDVSGNQVRHGGGAAQHRYGVNVAAATCDANRVTDNDLLDSGKTGSLNDAGTGTVTTGGNRL